METLLVLPFIPRAAAKPFVKRERATPPKQEGTGRYGQGSLGEQYWQVRPCLGEAQGGVLGCPELDQAFGADERLLERLHSS